MEARRLLGTNFTGPGPKGPCVFFFLNPFTVSVSLLLCMI